MLSHNCNIYKLWSAAALVLLPPITSDKAPARNAFLEEGTDDITNDDKSDEFTCDGTSDGITNDDISDYTSDDITSDDITSDEAPASHTVLAEGTDEAVAVPVPPLEADEAGPALAGDGKLTRRAPAGERYRKHDGPAGASTVNFALVWRVKYMVYLNSFRRIFNFICFFLSNLPHSYFHYFGNSAVKGSNEDTKKTNN